MWQPRIKRTAGTKFLGLVAAIEEDIAAGLIAEGEPMPPQRGVADALGIDLTTVTRAYNEAKTRGLIVARPGRGGTRVAESAETRARRTAESPVDLSLNIPPQPARADLATRIGRAVAEVLRAGTAPVLQYLPPIGAEGDRAAGAAFLLDAFAEDVAHRLALVGGAQVGLFAVISTLLGPGDTLLTAAVTYPGAREAAERVGARAIGIAMDRDGILPEAFAAACRAGRPRALYVVPTIDNPTTATLPEARRRALADIARRHGVAIIEDDPYRRLAIDAPPPIAVFAPELSWHIATLAKIATPGLRVAYVVTPDAAALARLGDVLRATQLMPPPLMAAVAARWISDGSLARITVALREEAIVRQAIAAKLLAGTDLRTHPAGHHAWLTLTEGWTADRFAAAAAASGVAVVPASAFAVGNTGPNAVRLSLGAAADRVALVSGLKRIASLLAAPRPA